ncbi:hypothetical protein OMW55_03175 [Sphingomonas sp. BN140010]|uniref:Uncharacterized protein n=1 Tax=Sphingomonas arvum TaxID=2992113 RepID=A0ABT3JCK2_9SPHN|nr:hypothetical protein [Sphingomonas sp. BN140010]MCW3796807.1 hypothetical protein [Sphingomonas sp. BN140010]
MAFVLLSLATATMQVTAPAADPAPTVVVTGRRTLDEAQTRQAVNAVSAGSELQMARYHDPVCPLVTGLPAEAGALVQDQIRDIARQVGLRTAPARCDANLIVMIAGDGQLLFGDIRRNRPEWLNGLSRRDIEALASAKGPVRAWSVTSLRNEDGVSLTPSKDGSAPATLRVQSASILKQPTRQQLDGSVIIIDRGSLNGRTLGQIAHYAAMRGLAMTRPPAGNEVGTVLSTFDNAAAPRSMTAFDLGYLKSLYASDGRDTGAQDRRRMARTIAEAGR